jgi:hypothetical protein
MGGASHPPSRFHFICRGNIVANAVDASGAGHYSIQIDLTNTNETMEVATCLTWAQYSRDLPPAGRQGGQWKAFGSLPSDFENGCVLLQDHNSLDIAYVLRQGISPIPYEGENPVITQSVPAFNFDREELLEQLVDQGNALSVTWLTPTNGAIPYLNSIPRNTAFLRDDGMTCFDTVCMRSGAMTHQELSEILSHQ